MTRFATGLAAALMLTATAAAAQESSPAYNFLNIPTSVTSYGQGGMNISAVNDDVENITMNPALLGPEMDKMLGLNYMYYIAGSNNAGVKYAAAAGERSAWALSLQYFGYGTLHGADQEGNLTGDFAPKDFSLAGYYSRDITDRLRGGAAIKVLYSTYEQYTAVALATDLGINYYDPERRLSLSAVVANLGGQVKRFTDSYDRLPIDVRLGWSQEFGNLPFRFSITAWNLTRWNLPYYDAGDGTVDTKPQLRQGFVSNLFRHLIFAADYVPSSRFHISLGYNYKTRTDMATHNRSFLSGFTLGAGLRVSKFSVGIAYAQPHTGANTFMVNLSTSINDFLR